MQPGLGAPVLASCTSSPVDNTATLGALQVKTKKIKLILTRTKYNNFYSKQKFMIVN
jgi:hypothetical protein